jgi:hypothetical protein
MKALWIVSFAASTLLATGCGKLISVQPLATDENIVFDPGLTGVWRDDDETVYTVRDDGSKSYEIDCVSKGKVEETTALKARLVQLGDQRVLDLSARKEEPFSISGHAFVRVTPVAEGLEIRFIGSEWLQDQIVQTKSPAHFLYGDRPAHPVITASSQDLEKFLRTFGLSEAALEEPGILHRVGP